jgi:hypothetical protein
MDLEKFNQTNEKAMKDFETMRMALKDNFEQLLATDNYLEKYMPFMV